MSPDILCSVKENLQQNLKINNTRIDKLITNMRLWKVDRIVYPNRIKSLLMISYEETYKILDLIKSMGILEYNYEIYCSECERFLDMHRMDSLNQFPDEAYCESGHLLSPLKDTVLVYKVVKDE